MKRLFAAILAVVLASTIPAIAVDPTPREPYGINLEGFPYPHPLNLLPLVNDGEQLRMAYMDVAPERPNGRTVVLLHGRNFPSSYWAPVITMLSAAGYRVVVPDQIGFGNPPSRRANCISTRSRATPSCCSIISGLTGPISWPIRSAACSPCASRGPIRTGWRISC